MDNQSGTGLDHSGVSTNYHNNYEEVRFSEMNPRSGLPDISPYSVSRDIKPWGEVPDVVPGSSVAPRDVTVTPGNSGDTYAMVRKNQTDLQVAENTVYHTYEGPWETDTLYIPSDMDQIVGPSRAGS